MGVWNPGTCQAAADHVTSAPSTPGQGVSAELPWWAAFHMHCHSVLLRGFSTSWGSHRERTRGTLKVSPGLCPRCLSLSHMAPYRFTVIKHSHEQDSVPMNHHTWVCVGDLKAGDGKRKDRRISQLDTSRRSSSIWEGCQNP